MHVLGKVAFAPVIASGLVAAGSTGATAAVMPAPHAHAAPSLKSVPFSSPFVTSTDLYSEPGAAVVGFAYADESAYCTSAETQGQQDWYFCTDLHNSESGWVPAPALGL